MEFPLYGRGEFVRVPLALNRCNWKENTVKFSDWWKIKPYMPNGYLPTLQINGGPMMDNTKALSRYICDVHGMYPSDTETAYDIEQMVEIISEDCNILNPTFMKTFLPKSMD